MKSSVSLHLWHRRIGIVAALFVIILVITGILLNHTHQLQLEQRFIGNQFLLNWYQISAPADPNSYASKNHRVTQIGQRLYFDQQEISESVEQLVGVQEYTDHLVIAIEESLLIVDHQGQLIEKLSSAEGVPAGIKRIGHTAQDELVIEAAHGNYLADIDELNWQKTSVAHVVWVQASAIPEDLKAQLFESYRGKGLTLERVLLDLHSGRILGKQGIYLIDAMAILFLILACTGIFMWLKYK